VKELKELLLKVRALEVDPSDIDIMVDNDEFLVTIAGSDVYNCYAETDEILELLFPGANVWKC